MGQKRKQMYVNAFYGCVMKVKGMLALVGSRKIGFG